MNLVTQESGPQKGTDSQTGILKGHPERFCVVGCACEARGFVAGIKKPRTMPRLGYSVLLVALLINHLLPLAVVLIHNRIILIAGEAFLWRVLGVNQHSEFGHR